MWYRDDDPDSTYSKKEEFDKIKERYQDLQYEYNSLRKEEKHNRVVQKDRFLIHIKKVDISSELPSDVTAKLQLIHGDFVVIPLDKLEK